MEKLVSYKEKLFILRPMNFDKHDMEFSIFDLAGNQIGSTFYGIKEGVKHFSSYDEKEEFMDWIQIESQKIEAEFKFLFEFNRPVESAYDLNHSAVEIMDLMQTKWSIPMEVMDAILP